MEIYIPSAGKLRRSRIKYLLRKLKLKRRPSERREILKLVETLQRRYHGYDPIVSTFDTRQLGINIDLICRAFLMTLRRSQDTNYIRSKLLGASSGMEPDERKEIFLRNNLCIGNKVSYWEQGGHCNFYFCSFRNCPYLLILHEYGTSVMNAAEEVLQSIQETYLEDLGFHLIDDNIPILVKDAASYYRIKLNGNFEEEPCWEDFTDDEQAWFNDQWEYLDEKNGVIDYSPTFFGKDRPYTAYKYVRRLFTRTSHELFIVDPFVDDDVFSMMEIVPQSVKIRLLSKKYHDDSQVIAKRFRRERGNFDFRKSVKLHDRYLFCDNHCYLFGSSLNNFGSLPTTIVPIHDKDLSMSIRDYFDTMWNECEPLK